MVTAWLFSTEIDESAALAKWRALTARDREELSQRPPELRSRDTVIRWFLRSVLSQPQAAVLRDRAGRPFIPGATAFSLSHSGPLALIATCDTEPIGADIEYLRRMPAAAATSTRRFTETERAAFLDAADVDDAFLRIWTLKEAVAKVHGTGLRGALGVAINNPLGPSPRLLSPGPPVSLHPCPPSLAARHRLRATVAAHPTATITWHWWDQPATGCQTH